MTQATDLPGKVYKRPLSKC